MRDAAWYSHGTWVAMRRTRLVTLLFRLYSRNGNGQRGGRARGRGAARAHTSQTQCVRSVRVKSVGVDRTVAKYMTERSVD